MTGNTKLFLFWFVALVAVVAMTLTYQGETNRFFGIAESRSQLVSFQHPVELKKLHVVPGQDVEKGDLVAELMRPDLLTQIAMIEHQIEEFSAERSASNENLKSELESLKAQEAAAVVEIDYEIRELESQHELNRKLLSEELYLKSKGNSESPLSLKIAGLKEKREHVLRSIKVKADNLRDQLEWRNPVEAKIEKLRAERDALNEKKSGLFVHALFAGTVGAVYFREGEEVAPFKPVITLHGRTPSHIAGYIHEDVLNNVTVGQQVWVTPVSGRYEPVAGFVKSVGSRIIEYPDRLKRHQAISAWGREVRVSIGQNSTLLLGEKVMVSEQRDTSSWSAFANPFSSFQSQEVVDLLYSDEKRLAQAVEASGALYLNDIDRFLVVGDEGKAVQPIVHLVTPDGKIEQDLSISEATAIDDMESITADADFVYIASSQSYSKKGKLKPHRKKLFRLIRTETTLTLDAEVLLNDLLAEAAQQAGDTVWAIFIRAAIADKSMDIETMFVPRDNELILGFKAPLGETGSTMFLRIRELGKMFSSQQLAPENIAVWRNLSFTDAVTTEPARVTDGLYLNGSFYFLTYSKQGPISNSTLWRFDPRNDDLIGLKSFPRDKAEGLAYDSVRERFMIVFDGGGKANSRFIHYSSSF